MPAMNTNSPVIGTGDGAARLPKLSTGSASDKRGCPRASGDGPTRLWSFVWWRCSNLRAAKARGGHHVDTTSEKRRAAFRRPVHNALISLEEIGAGEGIRTLDPNLGKVHIDQLPASLHPSRSR